jgi:hypothetical protein
MGHVACKLQQNTRSIACVVVLLKYDAPLLQLAINTLPSLTLANAVKARASVESVGISALLSAPKSTHC